MDKIVFPTNNGVVIHCGDKKVISAINCDGRKKLRSFKEKNKVLFWHFPFFRGLQYFFCGIWGLIQALVLAHDLCAEQSKRKKDLKKFYVYKLFAVGVCVIIGVAFSAIVFGLLPGKLGYLLVGYDKSTFLRNCVILVFKILLFYLFVLFLRIFPIMVEFFRFNRAGEVVVNGNAHGLKKTKTGGLPNFLNFVLFAFLLDFVVVTLCGASFGFLFNLGFHIAVFLLTIAVAYEFLFVCKKIGFGFVEYLTAFLVYSKPTRTHVETVSVALTEINLLCTQKGREFMNDESKKPFSIVYNEVKNKLVSAGINDKSDVDWLIATVLGKNRAEIKLVPFITDKQYQEIMKAVDRRSRGESLDNIFGWTEFFGIRFEVNKKVLTPRMETELLVEQVLKSVQNYKKATILDLGTGSGAIAISLAKNCDAEITAIDISKMALNTAESNAKKNEVEIEFLQSNLFEGLKRKRKFDIIVSNPPYIPTAEIAKLDKNVQLCDPQLALDGGEDGLDFYREITKQATQRLSSGGMLFYEIGKGQAVSVRKIMRENGFEEIKTIKDYNKIERIICGKFR